ncbi:DUF4129 domain-containing protein [Streptomyces sp. JJ66]|uniref:DUF4129 domain-containing protein n=1 Tax=Streptomyces sp. JJ66 TaxID=2803843 RepID=UPI001C58A0D2|nr:DUF4129 domain-containing protein [Streptomyces sp. JJ66]MBW1603261.1 DUF4129 domain-containing protein [Streptomyces sp. JJ66]
MRTTTPPYAVTAPGGDDVPVTIGRDAAREAAERELSQPLYQADEPGLIERAVNWLLDRLGQLLNTAADLTPGGLTGVVVIALVVIALLVALRLRLGPVRPQPRSAPGTLFAEGPRSAADHRAAAEHHATAAQWSPAVQERMRAIVRALEERTVLDPRPGRTADEAATEAGDALPEHAEALRAAAHAFDEITYADRAASAATYERLRDLDTALQQARPRLTASTVFGGTR